VIWLKKMGEGARRNIEGERERALSIEIVTKLKLT
jgi:hypothetical protein